MSNMVIATNVLALNSHRQLKGVGNDQAKSSEKLSSGFRINRAADDAAGLAISEKMRSQIRGLDQASRNSQDGISLIQTAEGALQETENMLQRMRELAVQASNETLTASDRDKIALEVDELVEEIDATAEKTEFNTKKLIDGSWKSSTIYFQTGANSRQGLEFNIAQMDATSLGTTKGSISSIIRGNGVDSIKAIDTKKITAKDATGVLTFANGATVEILENGDLKVSGMTVQGAGAAEATYKASDLIGASGALVLEDSDNATITISNVDGSITIAEGTGKGFTVPTTGSGLTTTEYIGEVKFSLTVDAGVTGGYGGTTAPGELTYNFKDLQGATFFDQNGEAVKIDANKDYTGADLASVKHMVDKNGEKFEFNPTTGKFNAASTMSIGFIAGNDDAKAAVANLAVTGQASGKVISGLTETIDKAIEEVSSQRAKLGAYQNRLEHTIKNLDTSAENLTASESRIRDTDMAKEMMNLTKKNVLQQAATSMLAQANQAPQNILKLLG